jgi:hypothetical protein
MTSIFQIKWCIIRAHGNAIAEFRFRNVHQEALHSQVKTDLGVFRETRPALFLYNSLVFAVTLRINHVLSLL